MKQWTWAVLSYSHNYIDENGQKIKFLKDLFKPNNVTTWMNPDKKNKFLNYFFKSANYWFAMSLLKNLSHWFTVA